MSHARKAVFLDRDGTINIEKNYLYRIEEWEWIPGAMEAIRAFNAAGFLVVVVTNQAGIARGLYTEQELKTLHTFVDGEVKKADAKIDRYYYCPHHPEFTDPCECRKPKPGMLLRAAKELNIDLGKSWMIGDRITDMQAAEEAGVKSLMVRTGYGQSEAQLLSKNQRIFANLADASSYILHN